MNPEEAPKLNPWPFIAGDLALLTVAAGVAYSAPPPLTGVPLLGVMGCVALGAVSAIVPFLVNYARRQDITLIERQNEIAALAQSTSTSAEQLSIAAASLHSIAENSARALKQAEQLPHKLQEKINEFKSQLNEVAVTDNEALSQEVNTLRTSETERLETALGAIRKIASELAALDAANRKHIAEFKHVLESFTVSVSQASSDGSAALASAQAKAVSAIEHALGQAVADLESRLPSALKAASTFPRDDDTRGSVPPRNEGRLRTADSPAPSERADGAAVVELPESESSSDTSPSAHHDSAVTTLVEAKPAIARKRPPKKNGIEGPELSLAYENDFSASASPDGLTRLLVTAYIGIGNKLYLRGDGPGLSWEKGVPLQFVSIGKWRWETADASSPLVVKLYKNDEQECALGALSFDPGQHCEVTAHF
jgi:hypothetical protein